MVGPVLERWLLDRLPVDSRPWLERAFGDVRAAGLLDDRFAASWSGAGRRVGRAPVVLSDEDRRTLTEARAPFLPAGWGTDELGRGLLLLAAADAHPPGTLTPLVEELYRKSEMREQQALLRILAYLPEPRSFAPLAAEAVRSNITSALEALACDNPFPAAYLDGLAFNQLVMKALFSGLPLLRIQGLRQRADAELTRMLQAFARERRAAGRPVPRDLQELTDVEPSPPELSPGRRS